MQEQKKTTASTIQLQTISYNSLKIGTLLGNGGYGDVYKATWHGTEVAIKELHLKTLSNTLQDEFNHESQVMAQCQFPHIIGLYGVCDEIGHKGFVMEYMPKGSLRAVLEDKRQELSWDIRWSIAIDIGKGLTYLHDKNILHRDLKSLNVLLGSDYHAKICDFGLSKIKLETNSSSTKNKAGTVRWRAPETFKRGFKPASSMDVYSYGMVLWEIASREIPFSDATDEMTAMGWIKDGEKETIPKDCPKAYGKVIEETWQEAEKRPSAEKIVTDLTKAKPEPISEISGKPTKSQKPYVEKSWHFDPTTERKVSQDSVEPYQVLEATEKDKQKVISFYQHHPVQGYEIGSVKVIYNRDFNQAFELQVKKLQHKDKNPGFTPKWDQENHKQWRAETNKKFEELAKPYSDSDYPAVKILPLWHGTKRGILDSIFKTGYANLASTDSGFFGKGLYGAHEAEYSYRVYGPGANTDGVLILNWVASFSAYPVIDGDMSKLTGKGNHQNYDAHFAPVVPKDPYNKNEVDYFPCKPNQKNTYTELVTFDSSACLPRYLVELQSNKPSFGISSSSIINLPKPHQSVISTTTTTTTSSQIGRSKQEQELKAKEHQLKEFELKLKQQELLLKEQQKKALIQNSIFAIKTEQNSITTTINTPIWPQKPQDQQTQKDLDLLLKFVTEGHLLEAEKLLEKNKKVAYLARTVTDLSGRTFKDITAFQYAAWALDIDMWEIILKYLDKQSAEEQLADLETNHNKYSNYGAHYDISLYTTKLEEYINNFTNWDENKLQQHWEKEVGGAQRQFPAWLVYAMCEEGENVAWVKKDMKHMKVTRQYEKEHLKWWFDSEFNWGRLGATWAVGRWAVGHARASSMSPSEGFRANRLSISRPEVWQWFVDHYVGWAQHDLVVGQSVKPRSHEALNSLKIQLQQPLYTQENINFGNQTSFFTSQSTPNINSPKPTQSPKEEQDKKDLVLLLKWVTEGHLIETEKLLDKNPKLALMPCTVTDLSGRTFKDISVFQYAAWALDVEMWYLLLKYLDNKSAGEQLTDLETNHKKYSNYGAHYDISLYTIKLDEYIKNYANWDTRKCQQHWQKEVGEAQRQFPAWLVYAMCEEGKNVAWAKKDSKNIKVTRQYDKGHLKWWFEDEYNGGKGVGSKWAVVRGEANMVASQFGFDRTMSVWMANQARHDSDVVQSVKSPSNEALNSLKIQLSNNNTMGYKF